MKLSTISSAFVGAATLALSLSTQAAYTFTSFSGLGDLPGGPVNSLARGVSGDGSVIVGNSFSAFGYEAFIYQNGVMTRLDDLSSSGTIKYVSGVSDSGSTIVGHNDSQALVYENGLVTNLGYLPGGRRPSEASSVSGDGSKVVGFSAINDEDEEAFVYQDGVMTGLGDLPGGELSSFAFDISSDGSTIVGGGNSANGYEAFIHQNGVLTGLGTLGGPSSYSYAYGVSGDGTTVVGSSGPEAFVYQNGIMTGLGDLEGGSFTSVALDVSADGSTSVGYGTSANGNEALLWNTDTLELTSIVEGLLSAGIDIAADGWSDTQALAISANGTTIVGNGNHNGTYVAWAATISTVPIPATAWLFGSALAGLSVFRKSR